MKPFKYQTKELQKRILFLGYNSNETPLIKKLTNLGHEVIHHSENLTKISPLPRIDNIISYGFRHIISANQLEYINIPIINLHISYLPWNRGAHPNFWAFYDSTPIGVSIHLIDDGIDTGPILFQKMVAFDKHETTFKLTYQKLKLEVEKLFMENLETILSRKFIAMPQPKNGTIHYIKDLPPHFLGWDTDIKSEILRLKKLST